MEPLTERQIRGNFVNLTKGQASRLTVPRDLADRPWEDLDYLGWRDPQSPDRAYLVAVLDGRTRGLALRRPGPGPWRKRRSMCSLCLTSHTGGVSLMVAPRAGKAGQRGDSVGLYVCEDLDCSLYLRGRKGAELGGGVEESLTLEEKVGRMHGNLAVFLDRVTR
ncbi:FBP domain-containing protein [Streptomyces sp. NPDC005438]|uniref:FBP domain-containing protein n=1 Tax=Streptomyces sp. NPDC005438 TaxID=3156880 RepID=UPI0033BF2164